jgi:ElaA protein
MTKILDWQVKSFAQLTTNQLYDLLKLRIDVFVVEQECYYPDLDEIDREPKTLHVFNYQDGKITSYCRVLAPGVVYKEESAIGRVIVSGQFRGQNLGYELMQQATIQTDKLWPDNTCHISAQEHLAKFYNSLGFEQISDMYLEDGIPHIAMRRAAYK